MSNQIPIIDGKKFVPKKLLKKPLLIVIFVLINVAVIAITAFSEFGNSANAAKLEDVKINGWFLIPAVICFLVAITAEISKYVLMMYEMSKDKEHFDKAIARKVARRTVLLGKYYDNITPAAIGGQPFQIYYMRKHSGMKAGVSTSIPVFGMVAGQLGFIIIALICFLLGSASIDNAVLIGTAFFGLFFYAFWPITVMIATFLPESTAELINKIVKLLAKLHIVKNQKATVAKVELEVSEYAQCVRRILKTKGLFLKTVLLSLVFNTLIAMIPFFVLTAFGGDVDFLPCFVTTVAVTSAVYFIPTPGNSGAAEGAFFLVFSALSTGYVFWAMLVWRFFSYYIYILLGPIIYYIMHLEKKQAKNGKKEKRKKE